MDLFVQINFLEQNMRYYHRHGRGKVEDIVHNEIEAKKRVVYNDGNFAAFCPFASANPFEVMIAPKKNISSLERCSRDDVTALAYCIRSVFEKLAAQLDDFDYNIHFMLAPLNQIFENEVYMSHLDKNYRFTIRIIPRIYMLGGFEIATGMTINPVAPEECAALLNAKEN